MGAAALTISNDINIFVIHNENDVQRLINEIGIKKICETQTLLPWKFQHTVIRKPQQSFCLQKQS